MSQPSSSTSPSPSKEASINGSNANNNNNESKDSAPRSFLSSAFEGIIVLSILILACYKAYIIRLYAIQVYGRIIHEFDPWFNFRATQYLADNGLSAFFKWYDHQSWYPLGRPVGTTIYPGMQMTAVAIWNVLKLKSLKSLLGFSVAMSLNDVCVFIPAWFGAIATFITGLLTREVSGSWRAAAISALIMAVIPAHMMRSVGGGYDNESVAMTAMVLTFYTWVRSLRTSSSWPIGILAGLSYAYMVASWGGFIFVGNMVGVHAAALILTGFYSSHLHKAYSLFFIIGTSLAVQVPVVGWSPFRSLEQIGPLGVFCLLQVLAACEFVGARRGLTWEKNRDQMIEIRKQAALIVGAGFALCLALTIPTGYFGPLSVRVRGLFVKHTRTGNPLVDSVAEHQPASSEAYWQYLHVVLYFTPVGLVVVALKGVTDKTRSYFGIQVQKWFIVLYFLVAYYFANRMVRLIILLGPVGSVLGGIGTAWLIEWIFDQFLNASSIFSSPEANSDEKENDETGDKKKKKSTEAEASKGKKKKEQLSDLEVVLTVYKLTAFLPHAKKAAKWYFSSSAKLIRIAVALYLSYSLYDNYGEFAAFSENFARHSSQPSLMFQANLNDGRTVMVRDYMDAYLWIKENTPQDSRVLSWWDYGYQISGIANRTTLADGNTWNLEHIALIGRILTSPEKRAHAMARHLADYVLVWAGNQQDDLAKSPHVARIASSVYPDVCPNDPLCRSFGFGPGGKPSKSMAKSMLYRMHSNGKGGVSINTNLFREVHTTKYGLVRIYQVLNISKKSKKWLADPANRICDAPGSWYCVGQYPPALEKPPSTHRHLDYDKLDRRGH